MENIDQVKTEEIYITVYPLKDTTEHLRGMIPVEIREVKNNIREYRAVRFEHPITKVSVDLVMMNSIVYVSQPYNYSEINGKYLEYFC